MRRFRRSRPEVAEPDDDLRDLPGLAETPWDQLRTTTDRTSAAPVPELVRRLVRGPKPAEARRSLETLYLNDHGGLLAEFVHPLAPVLIEVARGGDRRVRGDALEMLADFTHGSPMHLLPGETNDVGHELRMREQLRSGVEFFYEVIADGDHLVPALELVFFVEGHSARLEATVARLPDDDPDVRLTLEWIRDTP